MASMSAMDDAAIDRVNQMQATAWQNRLREVISGKTNGSESVITRAMVPDDLASDIREQTRRELAKQHYSAVRHYLKSASLALYQDPKAYKAWVHLIISGPTVSISRVKGEDGAFVPIPDEFVQYIMGIQSRPGRWGMDPRRAAARVRRRLENAAKKKRQQEPSRPSSLTRNGLPLIPVRPDAGVVTADLVRQLLDEGP